MLALARRYACEAARSQGLMSVSDAIALVFTLRDKKETWVDDKCRGEGRVGEAAVCTRRRQSASRPFQYHLCPSLRHDMTSLSALSQEESWGLETRRVSYGKSFNNLAIPSCAGCRVLQFPQHPLLSLPLWKPLTRNTVRLRTRRGVLATSIWLRRTLRKRRRLLYARSIWLFCRL